MWNRSKGLEADDPSPVASNKELKEEVTALRGRGIPAASDVVRVLAAATTRSRTLLVCSESAKGSETTTPPWLALDVVVEEEEEEEEEEVRLDEGAGGFLEEAKPNDADDVGWLCKARRCCS